MLEKLGLIESAEMFVYLMLSLSFFVGIMLIVSYEAFRHFDAALKKEYGWRRRLFPKIEDTSNTLVDVIITKYPLTSGIIIAVSAFILLLLYKPHS